MRTYTHIKSKQDSAVRSMFDGMMEVHAYQALQHSHRTVFFDELHYIMSRMIETASQPQPATEADLGFAREIGKQRGRERFSLDSMRAGFRLAFMSGIRELFDGVTPNNHKELTEYSTHAFQEFPRLLEAAEHACLSVYRDNGEKSEARRRLIEYLLDAQPAEAAARQAELKLANRYLVLMFQLRSTGSLGSLENEPWRLCLDTLPDALWQHDPDLNQVVVLLPSLSTESESEATASELAMAMHKAGENTLTSALAHARTREAIPEARQEAAQALSLAAVIPDSHLHPYQMDELLVELAISRQPAIRDRLTHMLERLSHGPDLISTLQTLFVHDLDRGATARALYIHRRTLAYRLNRIHALTGINPATPQGIQLLRAALSATRMG